MTQPRLDTQKVIDFLGGTLDQTDLRRVVEAAGVAMRSLLSRRLRKSPEDINVLNCTTLDLLSREVIAEFRHEPSAGNAAILFANAGLAIIGYSESLSVAQRNAIQEICRSVQMRPLPTLFWAEFVEKYLDSPKLLRLILAKCLINKRRLRASVRSVASQNLPRMGIASGSSVLVYGYSATVVDVMLAARQGIGNDFSVSTPEQSLPNRQVSDGQLLKQTLNRKAPDLTVEVVKDDGCLKMLQQGKYASVFMGCKVLSSVREKLTVVNSSDTSLYAEAATIAKVPVNIITGVYKFWPSAFYQRHFKEAVEAADGEPGNSIIPERHITNVLTEHGVYSAKELRSEYRMWFDYEMAPVSAFIGGPLKGNTQEYARVRKELDTYVLDMSPVASTPSPRVRIMKQPEYFLRLYELVLQRTTIEEMVDDRAIARYGKNADTIYADVEFVRGAYDRGEIPRVVLPKFAAVGLVALGMPEEYPEVCSLTKEEYYVQRRRLKSGFAKQIAKYIRDDLTEKAI